MSDYKKWFTEPISKRLEDDDVSVLVIATKFDKDGNLIEMKTLVKKEPVNAKPKPDTKDAPS